jgi:hypothetical protein
VRENTKNYHLKKAKEVRLMAKPIPATPVLEGQDVLEVLKELQRPDKAKETRMKAVESLKIVSRPGYKPYKV